jgi:multiple sugar transport system substrate-binding protein
VSVLGPVGTKGENTLLQQAITNFEQAHPQIKVTGRLVPDYDTALDDELRSAGPPDVFLAYSHQLADLVQDGRILPIPATYPIEDAIAPNLLAGLQVNGQNYCFPLDVATLALFYNPARFDHVKAAYPQNGWNWDQFRAAVDATGDVNNELYGFVEEFDLSRFFPFLLQASRDNDIWQGDDALSAVEYYMDMYNDEVAAVPARLDSAWNGQAFGGGKAAMTIEGNWLVDYMAVQYPDLKYGIVELPVGPAGRGDTAFITCWVVNAHAANVSGALELAAYLTSSSQVMAWANESHNLPPRIDQATDWLADHKMYAPFASALSYSTPWTGPAGFTDRAGMVDHGMDDWNNDNITTPELIGILQTMSQNPPLPTPTATPIAN